MNLHSTQIYVVAEMEGFHQWPGAPEEVDFLRSRHRHLFKVKAFFDVSHDDRQREFFIEQRRLKKFLQEFPQRSGAGFSCEMLAREIINALGATTVDVSEDGENGAIVSA